MLQTALKMRQDKKNATSRIFDGEQAGNPLFSSKSKTQETSQEKEENLRGKGMRTGGNSDESYGFWREQERIK